jgi:hypothetical protein
MQLQFILAPKLSLFVNLGGFSKIPDIHVSAHTSTSQERKRVMPPGKILNKYGTGDIG